MKAAVRAQAIVWDFDGVLLDSELLHMEAEFVTFKKFGFDLPPSVAREYFGIKLEDYFRDIASRFDLCSSAEEMIREHYDTLKHYYRHVFPLVPGAREVLTELHGTYPMAMATSRERELARLALERYRLDPLFELIIYGDDTSCGKPDPEPYLKACEGLGIDPEKAIAVEDAEAGFTSAKGAGLQVIARRAEHNRHYDFSEADWIIEDLSEIGELLAPMDV
jgi:HAD superfamily hydrolase (TIGR01509 family)